MNFLKNSKKAVMNAAVFVGSLGAVAAANATIDPAVSAALTAVKSDASDVNGLVMPIMVSVLGMTIVYKLIKRFSSKI